MAEEEHALLSPSGAHRWMVCPGSVVLEQGEPDEESEFAAEGTLAHALAAHCLTNKVDAKNVETLKHRDKDVAISREMADYVQDYIDYILARGAGQDMMIEQRVEIDWITGEKDAKGTADAVILSDNGEYMHVIDLKYGRGVKVYAEENPQLQMYAAGALNQFSAFGDYKRIKIHVHQPRLDHADEWETDIRDLGQFVADAKKAADRVREAQKSNSLEGFLVPGDKQCKFCKAKATCPALASTVAQITGADFDDLTQEALIDPPDLGAAMAKTALVEMWIKGVRSKVESELLAGRKVNGYKLVEGKKGNRQWVDDAEVEKEMKAMRMTQEEMYSFNLLSPAKIEKKLKDNPKRWDRIAKHITQKKGEPSVAPVSDDRPTYDPKPAEDFGDVSDDPLAIPKALDRRVK
jgi:hypothetical protein